MSTTIERDDIRKVCIIRAKSDDGLGIETVIELNSASARLLGELLVMDAVNHPQGWYTVIGYGVDHRDFCSLICLETWITYQTAHAGQSDTNK